MSMTKTISVVALVALSSACAGTLDDESFYRGASQSASAARDGGASTPDEGEQPEQPRAPETAWDAGQAQRDAAALEPGASDASKPWSAMDGALADASERWPSDAGPADAALPDAAKTAGDAASAQQQEAGAACDFRALISAKCGSAGCHGAGAVATGLDLTSDDLATKLDGRKGSGACASYALIDRADPARSAIYLKVTADACGSRMPLGGTLSDREQQCILQWIENL